MSVEMESELRRKIDELEAEREATRRVLDAAVNTSAFFVGIERDAPREHILEATAEKVRSFVRFRALSFWMMPEDGLDFSCVWCDPRHYVTFFESEIDPLVEDGTLAWALGRSKPVFVTSKNGGGQLLLHTLMTPSRTLGLLLGIVEDDPAAIADISLAFLSVACGAAAAVLQNSELYQRIGELNAELAAKVERLERSERVAEDANREKDRIIALVSHDIRTHLNGILGMSELLLDAEIESSRRGMLRTIRSEGTVLLRLMNDMLDVAKMEAGKLDIECVPFDLCDILTSLRDAFSPLADRKTLDWHVSGPETPVLCCGDPWRLRQTLMNLVSNAFKFTAVGEVSLAAFAVERTENYDITFAVADSGIGIPEDLRRRLFEPFVQQDAAFSRRFGGTGLGLTIVRQLVNMMGGSIEANDSPLGGAAFTIHLSLPKTTEAPVSVDAEPLGGEEETAVVPTGTERAVDRELGNLSVLVADDDETSRLVTASLLQKIGCRVEMAAGGFEAVERLRRDVFDMVLVDVQMPDLDGIEVVHRIRFKQIPSVPSDLTVIAVTARAMKGEREHLLGEGMSDWLPKPVSLQRLREVLQRHLPHRTGARERSFDVEALLRRLEGDEELARRVTDRFLEDAATVVHELRGPIIGEFREVASRRAHQLRGAAENVAARNMARLAAYAEEALNRDDPGTAAELAAEMESELGLVAEVVHAHFKAGGDSER